MEHRDGRTEPTAGRDPKLVWFTVVETRDEATRFESVVKKMCDQNPLSRVNHICQFSINQFCRFTSSAWPRCWAASVR